MDWKNAQTYRAWMLRLWQEEAGGPWRASLEDAHTGQRHHFATPAAFWDFIQALTARPPASASTRSQEGEQNEK